MKYSLRYSGKFDKSLKKCYKRGLNIEKLRQVISMLEETGTVLPQYKPHKLSGDYAGCWECHVQPDWLLIWEQNDTELVLLMIDTGTHSDLF